MKKKKKKEKKVINKYYVISIIIVVLAGVIGIIKISSPKYMNNYLPQCGRGFYYYSSFLDIFGHGCKKCPIGQYCPGDDKHYDCDNRSTTTRHEGSESNGECTICKDGSKWYNGSSCVSCVAPYYCSGGERHSCEAGKTITKDGATKESDCVPLNCKKSEFINDLGRCETCPMNHYCNGIKKTACGDNRISSMGSTSSSACICEPGRYDTGYFCIMCPSGSYCKNGKENKCPSGYTSGQYTSEKTKCYRNVAAGKSVVSNKVTSCAKGTYSEARVVYYGQDSKCTSCPAGTYQDATGQSKCKKCPTDYTSSKGAKAKSECYRNITAGRSLVNGKIYRCSKGSYSVARKGYYGIDNRCTPCPAGTYQDKEAQSSCKKCSTGYTSKKGSSSCTRSSCPAGSYLDSSHSTGCRTCPSNKYCPGGSTMPQSCKSGQTPNSSRTGCRSCSGIANCSRYGGNGVTCKCTSCASGYMVNGSGTCTKVTKPCASRGTVGECNADGKCKWDYSYGCRNK